MSINHAYFTFNRDVNIDNNNKNNNLNFFQGFPTILIRLIMTSKINFLSEKNDIYYTTHA